MTKLHLKEDWPKYLIKIIVYLFVNFFLAEFPAGGLDYWRISVDDEDRGDKQGGQQAKAGKHHGCNGLGVTPAEILHWDQVTTCRDTDTQ